MSINDRLYKKFASYGGETLNERINYYLGSLGYTGSFSDRLSKLVVEGRRGRKALIYESGIIEDPFDPIVLFEEGQLGAWYDPSDLSTLFQDTAGTTPVVAAGDPVGLMQDKSGNDLHVTVTDQFYRPIYQTDGARHWLALDGGNDFQLSADLPEPLANGGCFMAAVHGSSIVASYQGVITEQSTSSPYGRVSLYRDNGTGGELFCVFSPTNAGSDIAYPVTSPDGDIVSFINYDGTTLTGYANGELVGTQTPTDTEFVGTTRLDIGRQELQTRHLDGEFYGAIVRGTPATEVERNDTTTYLASKAGLSV